MELLGDVGVSRHRRDRAVAGRGDDLAEVLVANVAGSVDAFDGGLHLVVGDDPAALALLDKLVLLEEGDVRLGADEDEASRDGEVGDFAGLDVLKDELLDYALAFDGLDDGVPNRDDLRVGERLVDRVAVGSPLVAAVDNVNLVREAGEVSALFDRDVAAADDRDRLALKEGGVADRAVADAGAGELGFAGASELAEGSAGGDDDGLGLYLALVGDDDLVSVADFDVLHGAASELSLEVLGVLAEGLSELGTGRVNRSGPVLDFVGDVDLSARGALLKDERVEVGAASVDRGRKSGRAGAEYYKFSLFHSENILSYF